MNLLDSFQSLSADTGIALPGLLQKLLATGNTVYGANWSWKTRSLSGEAPFASWYDFEWIDAADARDAIERWLNPGAQDGRVFLPFAQSGAGDAYCLMPLDAQTVGVALIWHDDDSSRIGYRSFEDFVVARYLETFADLSHLEGDFSTEEIHQCVSADVSAVSEWLPEPTRRYLWSFCERPLTQREFRHGPKARPQQVLSLISQAELEVELGKIAPPDSAPFKVVAAWEIDPPTSVVPESCPPSVPVASNTPEDWRSYALDPKRRLEALQAYRKEFNVSLAEAKLAIDHYIEAAKSAE